MDKLINVSNRMIDALKTEHTKQEQQHLFLSKLIYTSPTGILILDHEENIQQVNPNALQLLGVEEKEVQGKSINLLSNPVIKQVKQLESGQAKTFKLRGAVTLKSQKSHFNFLEENQERKFKKHSPIYIRLCIF